MPGCYDSDNGALDQGGYGCDAYASDFDDYLDEHYDYDGDYFYRICMINDHDDNDFNQSTMCCACGGGNLGIIPGILYDLGYIIDNGK
jgi:hypothetical protein